MNSKKRLCFLFSIILLIIALAVSCDLVKESNTTIAVRDDVIVVGRTMGQLQRPVDVILDIQNGSGSFKAIDNGRDVSNWLVIPSYPDVKGIKLTVNGAVKEGDTSIALQITMNSDSLNYVTSAINEARFEFKVPVAFLNDRINDVQVQSTGKQLFMNILGQDSTSSYIVCNSIYLLSNPSSNKLTDIQGFANEPINEYVMNFVLVNNTFAQDLNKDDYDISAWITPNVSGLRYSLYKDVKKGDNSFDVLISGTPNTSFATSLMKMKLNSNILTTPNRNMYSAYMPTLSIKPQSISKVQTSGIEVSGVTTVTADDITVNQNIPIVLGGGIKFASAMDANADVSAWFKNAVPGLNYNLLSAITVNDTSTVVVVSGSPTSPSNEEVQIRIPYTALDITGARPNATFGGLDSLYINPNGTRYNITKGDFISWRLFDLASFPDMGAVTLSENKDMTTAADGTPIEWADASTALVAEGIGSTITYTKGFKRHGFVLKGFTYRYKDDTAEVNPNNILWKWTNQSFADGEVFVDEDMWTTNIKDYVIGRPIDIFAVWAPDSSGKTVDENDDEVPTTAWWVKEDISANGKYFPMTYNSNGNPAYVDQPFYNEVKVPAKGYKMLVNGVVDVALGTSANQTVADYTTDFAIGEHVITGYMIDVLREWNKGTEGVDGSPKGFAIPDMTDDLTPYQPTDDNNKIAYGTYIDKSAGTDASVWLYGCKNDPSSPIVLSPSQAFVISNAFTAYYNDMHKDEESFVPLTYAYTVDRNAQTDDLSNVVKTIAQADTLYALNTQFGDPSYGLLTATGFRIPTVPEYEFATRAIPNNDYTTAEAANNSSTYKGTMYPQFQLKSQVSGGRSVATNENKGDYSLYSWHNNNSTINNVVYMHGFDRKIGTLVDKLPNNMGLYGMQSNIYAMCDLTVVGGSGTVSFRLLGFPYSGNSGFGTGSMTFTTNAFLSISFPGTHPGLRLVRTLND